MSLSEIKANSTLKIMFEKRNYTNIREEKNILIGEIEENEIEENEKEIVIAVLEGIEKLKKDNINSYINIASEFKSNHIILYYYNIVPTVFEICKTKKDLKVELFEISNLQFDITEYFFQPKFEKLNKENFKQYNLNKDTLSIILETDPISRFYNYKKGDLIKITRRDGSITIKIIA